MQGAAEKIEKIHQVQINRERCKGCELCRNACPQGVISMSKNINIRGYYYAEVADAPRCIACCLCAITCPDQAIEVGVNGTLYRFFDY